MSDDYLQAVLGKLREKLGERAIPFSFVLFEEMAREIGQEIMGVIPKPLNVATKKVEFVGKVLDKVFEPLNIKGRGTLREVYAEFSAPNIRINLEIDDLSKIPEHSNLNDLIKISPYLEFLDVVVNDENYIVHISDLKFLHRVRVLFLPLKPVNLIRTFALYDIVV